MAVKRALGFTLGPIVWFILLALSQSPCGLWVQWPHGLSGSAERWPPASAPLSLRPGSHQEQAGVPVPSGTVWRRPRGRPWTRENVCWLECVMMRTGRKKSSFQGFSLCRRSPWAAAVVYCGDPVCMRGSRRIDRCRWQPEVAVDGAIVLICYWSETIGQNGKRADE